MTPSLMGVSKYVVFLYLLKEKTTVFFINITTTPHLYFHSKRLPYKTIIYHITQILNSILAKSPMIISYIIYLILEI